jgi:hypothetical protein
VLRGAVGVAGCDSNQVKFHDYSRNTLRGARGHIFVASKSLKMLFFVYASAVPHVTSLSKSVSVEYRVL